MTLSFRNRSSLGLFGDKEWESLSNCIPWNLQCCWIRPRYLETHFKFILISVSFILLPMLTLLVSSLSGNPRPAIIICKMGICPHLKIFCFCFLFFCFLLKSLSRASSFANILPRVFWDKISASNPYKIKDRIKMSTACLKI